MYKQTPHGMVPFLVYVLPVVLCTMNSLRALVKALIETPYFVLALLATSKAS